MTPDQQKYRDRLCRQYVGDQQGFLAAEASAMLRGKLPMDISADHQQAWLNEHVKVPLGDVFEEGF
jgi:hypothetical protein